MNTAAGAERLPAFDNGWRSFGARAPSLFAPSGPRPRGKSGWANAGAPWCRRGLRAMAAWT